MARFFAVLSCLFTINCGVYRFGDDPTEAIAARENRVTCPIGETYDGHRCVDQTSLCSTYTELVPTNTNPFNGNFHIPERSAVNECFYAHLIPEMFLTNKQPAGIWETFRTDVVSRFHARASDSDPAGYSTAIGDSNFISGSTSSTHANNNPRIIGSIGSNSGARATISFTLGGSRNVSLRGSSNGDREMRVDNFILVDGLWAGNHHYLAKGTSDALPWVDPNDSGNMSTTSITVSGQPVILDDYAPDGTASITPISLTLPTSEPITLEVTGLDCGGIGGISDVYLLFQ